MSSILGFYAIIFSTYIKDIRLSYYCITATILIFTAWYIFKKKVKLESLVSGYLLVAPLFCAYTALRFWSTTTAVFVWLVPIPFGTYVFFKNKIVIYTRCAL